MRWPWQKRPIRDEPIDRKLRQIMKDHGWFVIQVAGDEVPFGYTVGVSHTFGQPELFISGLRLEDIHAICNQYGERIRAGWIPSEGQLLDDALDGESMILFPLHDAAKEKYLGVAVDEFHSISFPALQGVWTHGGALPMQPEWPERLKRAQFLLSLPEDWPEPFRSCVTPPTPSD